MMNNTMNKLIKRHRESDTWYKYGGMIYCRKCAAGFDACFVNDFKYCPNCGQKKGEQPHD